MPFSVRVDFGGEEPVVFHGWLDDVLGRYVPKGTPFAKASSSSGDGFIVTNGPVFLSSTEGLQTGSLIVPGAIIAYGGAEGEDIPYGKPYCVFVLKDERNDLSQPKEG